MVGMRRVRYFTQKKTPKTSRLLFCFNILFYHFVVQGLTGGSLAWAPFKYTYVGNALNLISKIQCFMFIYSCNLKWGLKKHQAKIPSFEQICTCAVWTVKLTFVLKIWLVTRSITRQKKFRFRSHSLNNLIIITWITDVTIYSHSLLLYCTGKYITAKYKQQTMNSPLTSWARHKPEVSGS